MDGRGGKRLKLQAPVAEERRRPDVTRPVPAREPEQPPRVLRLHITRGSFVACSEADDMYNTAAAGHGAPIMMDAEVWHKLPEELVWEVVVRLPAAKHFQLHSVSHKWRRVLTSPDFRKRIAAAAATRVSAEEPPCVVGCVQVVEDARLQVIEEDDGGSSSGGSSSSGSSSEVKKMVDFDLSSLVPSWFWSKYARSYFSVVAAANGLVCIGNDSEMEHLDELENCEECRRWLALIDYTQELREHWRPWANRYCALNLLTRTCIVLPELPFLAWGWLPPTAAAVTTYDFDWEKEELQVATYDLAAGGGGSWTLAVHKSALSPPGRNLGLQALARCSASHSVMYSDLYHDWGHQDGMRLLEAAAAGAVDNSYAPDASTRELVPHRGEVFLVVQPAKVPHLGVPNSDDDLVVCGVWRLAVAPSSGGGQQLAWEPLAQLHLRDLQRLTGFEILKETDIWPGTTHGVRELLYCPVFVVLKEPWIKEKRPWVLLLAVNLGTGDWELVNAQRALKYRYEEGSRRANCKALELRPDVFL